MTKTFLITLISFCFLPYSLFSEDAKSLFKTNCSACHTIGKGRLVGPDLKGVTGKRSADWLLKWIKSSPSFIKSGDADAIAIFKEYNEVPMTDFSFLSDAQINSIITFMNEEGSSATAQTVTNVTAAAQPNQTTSDNRKEENFFTTSNILLLLLSIFLLTVVIILSRIIKKLSEQLSNCYEGKRAFL